MSVPALPLALALALLVGQAGAVLRAFQLSGACDERNYLNGLTFRMLGRTRTGAPYYKADGVEEYMYYDPDCSGGNDGASRWILDNDRPSVTATEDLDQDGVCEYHARIDCKYNYRMGGPPTTGTWYVNCGSKGWQDRFMTLIEVTSTSSTTSTSSSTSTSTTATTTTRTRSTTTTSKTATATETATTATSTELTTTETDTSTTETATWTGTTLPETSTTTDLPSSTELTSTVTSTETDTLISSTATATDTETETVEDDVRREHHGHFEPTPPPVVLVAHLHSACAAGAHLDGLVLTMAGNTATGAPYYASDNATGTVVYMYYDPSCDGFKTRPAPRWILDTDQPDLDRPSDLDEDHKCDYLAAVDSKAVARPPPSAAWHMNCGSSWKVVVLSFAMRAHGPLNSTTATTTVAARGFLISSARGRWPSVYTALVLALAAAAGWLGSP